MLVSFVYVITCRLFALVLLLARSDRSKELEILVLRHEPLDPAAAGAAPAAGRA